VTPDLTTSTAFVLTLGSPAGKGYFSNAASGVQQALWPGDSIISLHGAANFAAGPLPNQDPKQQDSTAQQQTSRPAWSQLLGWLQHLHTKQQHNSGAQQLSLSSSPAAAATAGTAAVQHGSSNQLVMLQLLLPSELLTGEMLSHHAGHGLAVAEQLPWGPAALQQSAGGVSLHGLAPAGSILEAQVCGLLVDGGLGSPEPQPAQQSMQDDFQQQTQEQHQHPVQSSSNSNSSNSGGGSVSAHILPGLHQQQISKRALSEVGAFRLPQQTNRLALLFGPHCSPAVCCSFGVEVFEPGHVTPLHIHNTAHELFFVLAGKGEAVFKAAGGSGLNSEGLKSRQPQRVSVSPGDVAVFAPGIVHGVDNPSGSQLYCLQMMLPNEFFVEFVRSGEEAGRLDVTAVQRIAAAASCG
jgi:mannose-6-phosphate isomerase-like protein (cupin superfamily)